MSGLPSEFYKRCQEVLRGCAEFRSDESLRAAFVTQELRPFQDSLPSATSVPDRVGRCLDFLLDRRLSDGRPVLPLFLAALRDRYRAGDALRDEIEALTEDVRSTLSSATVTLVPEHPDRTPQIPSPGMAVPRPAEVRRLRETLKGGPLENYMQLLAGIGNCFLRMRPSTIDDAYVLAVEAILNDLFLRVSGEGQSLDLEREILRALGMTSQLSHAIRRTPSGLHDASFFETAKRLGKILILISRSY